MQEKTIHISEYNYPLPEERIAKFPLDQRDASKLLIYQGGEISQTQFRNLQEYLPEGTLLVFNNTKVIRARLLFFKETGARIEIFCLEPHDPADYERAFAVKGQAQWSCMIGNRKKWKAGELSIHFDIDGISHQLTALLSNSDDPESSETIVDFHWDADLTFGQLLEVLGRIPIPPYLCRESEEMDNTRYQTVYSRFEGSVAAPTAGLHFTPEMIESLQQHGFSMGEITLHVGAGTFLPVKTDDPTQHAMHTEHFEIAKETLQNLIGNFRKVIAVGTTSVRTLESLAALGYRVLEHGNPNEETPVGQWEIYDIRETATGKELLKALLDYMEDTGITKLKAATRIMIMPGYQFRIVSGIITNFHQPQSTLLLLVSAFIGEDWRRIYDYALGNEFRFLSYGDSSLLLP